MATGGGNQPPLGTAHGARPWAPLQCVVVIYVLLNFYRIPPPPIPPLFGGMRRRADLLTPWGRVCRLDGMNRWYPRRWFGSAG